MRPLYEYEDYRGFLRDYYASMKARRVGWSLSVWAKQLQISSPSTILMILKGDRTPSDKLVAQFVRYFRFDDSQAEFFEAMVQEQKSQKNPRLLRIVQRFKKEARERALQSLRE